MAYKYERLVNLLREQLAARAGDGIYQLPTETELCHTYGVSRQTVRKALAVLEQEHLIERRRGSGSFATGLKPGAGNPAVAILAACDDAYTYPYLLSDIQSGLHREGYLTRIFTTGYDVFAERKHLEALLADPPRGLIAEGIRTALPSPNLDLYEQLQGKGVPILFYHGISPNINNVQCVQSDDFKGSYLLSHHLIEQGHTRIAGLFNADEASGIERYYGWISAMRDFHLTAELRHISFFDSLNLTSLRQKQDTGFLTDFIASNLKPCTAVICHNDEIAYWLIQELQLAGYEVPEQISIASFDNSYLSTLSQVPLTGMTHRSQEPGQTIVRTFLQIKASEPVASLSLPWKLVTRTSIGPPPGPDVKP